MKTRIYAAPAVKGLKAIKDVLRVNNLQTTIVQIKTAVQWYSSDMLSAQLKMTLVLTGGK